jgi:hypothetical protein
MGNPPTRMAPSVGTVHKETYEAESSEMHDGRGLRMS